MKCVSIVIRLIIVLCLLSCGSNSKQSAVNKISSKKPSESELTAVEVVQIAEKSFENELIANGKLTASNKANIRFSTEGLIRDIYISDGQYVRKGDILARLDGESQERVFEQSRLNYERAVLDYEDHLLRLGYKQTDTASMPSNLKHIARLRSGLAGAILDLQKAREDLERISLRSPMQGQIANVRIKPYNLTNSAEYFCTVIDDRYFDIDFLVLEQELSFVKQAGTIRIMTFESNAVPLVGKIININPLVDKGGMISVRARVSNTYKNMLDGMNVKIIISRTVPSQLLIPKSALLERQGKQVVFTAVNGLAYWNYVKVAYENSQYYAISEGLKAGDSVIFKGNFNLAHNKPVQLNNNSF